MLTCALLRHCSKGASEAENATPDVQLLSLLEQEPASCQQRSWEVSKTVCHAPNNLIYVEKFTKK